MAIWWSRNEMNPIAFHLPPCCALARASCFDLAGPSSFRLPQSPVLSLPFYRACLVLAVASGIQARARQRIAVSRRNRGMPPALRVGSCQPAGTGPSRIVHRTPLMHDRGYLLSRFSIVSSIFWDRYRMIIWGTDLYGGRPWQRKKSCM